MRGLLYVPGLVDHQHRILVVEEQHGSMRRNAALDLVEFLTGR
nr:hypothetical protein [Streptomyces bambusae]